MDLSGMSSNQKTFTLHSIAHGETNTSALLNRRLMHKAALKAGELDREHEGAGVTCVRCGEPFCTKENIICAKDQLYHHHCFRCSQCFCLLSCEEFYEFEGRKYCKYDYQVMFAPFCHKCHEFIMGKVVRAIGRCWHPDCLTCENCGVKLLEAGLQQLRGRPYCRVCFSKMSQQEHPYYICASCRCTLDPAEMLRYKGDTYHAHHFKCTTCEQELGPEAREIEGNMYCLLCSNKMGIPVCAACRRQIEGRVVRAIGKAWHVEHFVCHHCETPFRGSRYYEFQGHAYCLLHYQSRTGNLCYICQRPVTGVLAKFTNKAYCPDHFACFMCDRILNEKSKIYEIDLKPACKQCYERLPTHWKRRLAKLHLSETQL
ncbi:unnamed protein product [Calicophoron daubneyi]|uniref:LIM zinc-binding domain-containing protein n=1 Tax=Calicophoron daubneyi TaxID=300641 RepID=A0AAV2T6R3_CALDB